MSGRHKLSGYAVPGPPVETVITPRTGGAIKAALVPVRRRRSKWKLFPPYIVYPLPPASPEVVTRERPKLVVVGTARAIQRRRPRVLLRQPSVVIQPALAGYVTLERPKLVAIASARSVRRLRPRFVLGRPSSVGSQVGAAALGGVGIQLVQPPRARDTYYVLHPPVVVNP